MVRAAFGTNNVDNCARVCLSASVHGLAQTLGSGAMTNPIADITEDVDMILLVGSNPKKLIQLLVRKFAKPSKEERKLLLLIRGKLT